MIRHLSIIIRQMSDDGKGSLAERSGLAGCLMVNRDVERLRSTGPAEAD